MPLSHFICPDTKTCPVEECLKKCRLDRRCVPIAYAIGAADERTWTGTPSVTQLLRGTREAWLRITRQYSIRPDSRAWALLGTAAHTRLEDPKKPIVYENISMTPDAIELHGEQHVLIDYKTSGSYFVAKLLGIVQDDPDPAMGPKSKKGPKTFRIEPMAVDRWEYEMQLNMYRIGIERAEKIPIHEMVNFIIVRDGDTYIAKNRGITERLYTIYHNRLSDEEVLAYFINKRDALLYHLKEETMPPLCNSRERWEWRKCEGYCDVSAYCDWQNAKEMSI